MAGYFDNSRAREERIRSRGGLRGDDMVDLSGGDDMVDLSGGGTPLSRQNEQADWDEAVRLQTADRDEAERQRRQKEIDGELAGFDKLVNDANAVRQQHFHNLDVTALAMFRNAARSPYGASDPALNGAGAKGFGIPGFSGIRLINEGEAAGSFAVMQAVKGQNGQIVSRPVMLLGPDTMNGISMRLRRNGYSNADVTAMSNYAWKAKKMQTGWTDDQLVKAGFSNPNGPVLMGQTTNGKAMSVLAGRTGDRHSRISVFASDGHGGATRQFYDGHTGDFYEEDIGTRAPDAKTRWKVRVNGPDGKVYVNDKTGEEVTVKPGETPPWQKGQMSDKDKIALARANADAADKGSKDETRKGNLLMKEKRMQMEAIENVAKSIESQLKDPTLDAKTKAELQKRLDAMRSALATIGGVKASDEGLEGKEEPRPADAMFGGGTPKQQKNAVTPKVVVGDLAPSPEKKEVRISEEEFKSLPDDQKQDWKIRTDPKTHKNVRYKMVQVEQQQKKEQDKGEEKQALPSEKQEEQVSPAKPEEEDKADVSVDAKDDKKPDGEISDDELISMLGKKYRAAKGESREKWAKRLRTIYNRPTFREFVRRSSNFTR